MSYRADKQVIDTRTHWHKDAADDNTRRPKLASGKNGGHMESLRDSRYFPAGGPL